MPSMCATPFILARRLPIHHWPSALSRLPCLPVPARICPLPWVPLVSRTLVYHQ